MTSRTQRLHEEVERVYEETRSTIHSYLLCLGVPHQQSQEITQEVYLRLYKTMQEGKEIDNRRAWLFRVAHNLGLKIRAKERVISQASPEWEKLLRSPAVSPEQRVLERERMSRLASALESLSSQQRHCLYLRSEGLRYREIAEVMGITPSSVNEFLRRAVSRLAEAVDG